MIIQSNNDTIFAPATIPGTGAISLIRISGPDALDITDKVVKFRHGSCSSSKGYEIKYGAISKWNGSSQVHIDDVLVSIFRAPKSYTGENSTEISCHASQVIVNEILKLLSNAGGRPAEPGEFTKRAFMNGKMDLTQAEAVADVISSSSEAALKVAQNQLKGGLSSEMKELRKKISDLAALLELELDFSEEDVEFADRKQLLTVVDQSLGFIERIRSTFSDGNAIKNGIPVAIAGATNTGKSTLMNRLLNDDRSIVSDVEGTTRDTVEESLTIDGLLFRFIDTAGLRSSDELVENLGIERSYSSIRQASVVLCVLDITRPYEQSVSELDLVLDSCPSDISCIGVILNKCDKISENYDNLSSNNIVTRLNTYVSSAINKRFNSNASKFSYFVSEISAKSGFGVEKLLEELSESQKKRLDNSTDRSFSLLTNVRHYNALSRSYEALVRVKQGICSAASIDMIAQDLRDALYYIGSITGEITNDEILHSIFSNFCIGK